MYKNVVIVNGDSLGRGDQEVGHTLLGTFLRKLLARSDKPDAIIFYNSAVRLVTKESYFLDILSALESTGVELLACGTCVYKVCGPKSMRVGRMTTMEEIADIVMDAQKVITL